MSDTDYPNGTPASDATSSDNSAAIKGQVAISLLHALQPNLDTSMAGSDESIMQELAAITDKTALVEARLAAQFADDDVAPSTVLKAREWTAANADVAPAGSLALALLDLDIGSKQDGAQMSARAIRQHVWTAKGGMLAMIAPDLPLVRPREGIEVPPWLLSGYGLIDAPTRRKAPAPAIPSAFEYAGIPGLGQTFANSIYFALLEAMTAPKDKWGTIGKGWPAYRVPCGGTTIAIALQPEVVNRLERDEQIAAMHRLKNAIDVSTWDTASIMTAQVLAEGRADASATMTPEGILSYRNLRLKQKKDGYSAGHQSSAKDQAQDSVYVLAHVHIMVEDLPIAQLDGKGQRYSTTMTVNEKLLQIEGGATLKANGDEDERVAWRYRLGRWSNTFTAQPNKFVAIQLQRVLQLNPRTQQWAKQLGHYLTLEFRRNADNGRALPRTIAQLLKGAQIPLDHSRPSRTAERLDVALRTLIREGVTPRIDYDGHTIDGDTPGVDTWSTVGKGLPGNKWLDAWQRKSIMFYADETIERHYDKGYRRVARPKGG